MPSISEWWVLVISAKRSSSRPSISHISHSGFERSSCWEKIRAVRSCSCSHAAGGGQRGVADVVLEVEAGVIDPHRASAVDRCVGELVAVARDQVQSPADLLEELVHARRRAFDDRQAADVHVRDGALLVQERGVYRRQPVEVALGHQRLAYLGDPYNDMRVEHASKSCCSRRRAATARASIAPCRRSNARSSIHGAPGVRAQGDRPQQARRRAAARARRDLRRRADRGARRGRCACSPPMASPRACAPARPSAACRRSTRPARW